MRLCRMLLAAVVVFCCSVCAHADTIFSNIAAGYSGGEDVQGSNFRSVGAAFMPSGTYILTDTEVKVGQVTNALFNEQLYSDSNGKPGTLLATLGVGLLAPFGVDVVTLNTSPMVLAASTQYWLVLSFNRPETHVLWAGGGSSPVLTATNTFFGGWSTPGMASLQFQVNGTPVVAATPEPSSFALLGTGLLGMAGALRRRAA